MTSCGERYVYDETIEIPDNIWTYDNAIDFEFEVEDTTQLYNCFIEVKHHEDYENQNAYTKLKITRPDGTTQNRELSFELASAEGNWLGKCSGNSCTSKLIYNQKGPINFTQVGKFKMHFEQYTRQDSLKGISSLRVMLQKADLELEEK